VMSTERWKACSTSFWHPDCIIDTIIDGSP
jgi:hypothetical protein